MTDPVVSQLLLAAALARSRPSLEEPSLGDVMGDVLEAAGNEHHRAAVLNAAFREVHGREPVTEFEVVSISEASRACVPWAERLVRDAGVWGAVGSGFGRCDP